MTFKIVVSIECIVTELELHPLNINAKEKKTLELHLIHSASRDKMQLYSGQGVPNYTIIRGLAKLLFKID